MPYTRKSTDEDYDDGHEADKSYGDMLGGLQQAAPAATAAASTLPTNGTQAAPGQTATGYLNFGDFYNANQGVAQREANKLEKKVGGAAKASQDALAKQTSGFSQGVQAGTFTEAPRDIDVRSSKQSDALKDEQGNIDDEFYDSRPGTPDYDGSRYLQTESGAWYKQPTTDQQNLNFQGTGADMPDYLTQTPKTPAEMAALAAQGYTGPNSLDEGAGYADLLNNAHQGDTQLAALAGLPEGGEQNLDAGVKALLHDQGATDADAALVGSAGRKKFHDLNQLYGTGHSLEGWTRDANEASKAEAAAARKTSEDNAGEWKKLLGNHDVANKAVQDRSDALAAQDKETQGREDRAGNFRRNVVRGNHDVVSHVVRGIGEAFDPVAWASKASGNKSPEQWANEKIDPAFNNMTSGVGMGTNVDSTSYLGWTDDDFDVYDSMTPEDWAQFNSLPDDLLDPFNNPKRKWIESRKQQIRSQPKKKKGG